ncbi:hypothetical protein [Roseibium sp. M-1]
MTGTLREVLSGWDGRDTGVLEQLFESECSSPVFLDQLVALSALPDCQRSATWLLKHHFDGKGQTLSETQTRDHLAHLAQVTDWQARLHVLQYLEHLALPQDAEIVLSAFVDDAIASKNKLVRAWAYYALALLACRYPERKHQALTVLRQAGEMETAGSVKVRLRKALEKLELS